MGTVFLLENNPTNSFGLIHPKPISFEFSRLYLSAGSLSKLYY